MGMGFPMGMGIKRKNGNWRKWEIRSMGMGITCTAMEIYYLII